MKKFLFTLISGFIALLLFNMDFEVAAETLPTPTPAPYWACPAGQYGIPGEGCVDADPGHFVPGPGATEQIECPVGRYQPNSGSISCIIADPGHYVDTTGSAIQTKCAVGTYQPIAGSASCLLAGPGHYVSTTAATAQTACAPGSYQPASGAISCIPADPGHYVSTTAATGQTACAPGYYQPVSGAVSCIAADPGSYVPEPAATEQLLCPAGTTSSAAATECTPAGYTFTGFFQPVDMSALNVVKAGQAIPIKFSLSGDHGLDIMAAAYPAQPP